MEPQDGKLRAGAELVLLVCAVDESSACLMYFIIYMVAQPPKGTQ